MKLTVGLLLFVYILRYVKSDAFENSLGHIKTQTTPEVQAQTVSHMINRLIPERSEEFTIEVNPNLLTEGREIFTIFNDNGTVLITGTTGVVAATGFQYYLKYCGCHVSWEVSQLDLPTPLPRAFIRVDLNDRFRYYQNVCTTSYSFVWWDWKQWEKHIDWMALNSFNLVLSFHGQEAIWDRVYRTLNLTDDDINEQFTGPAFLSWLRMGNIRGWGGPLSKSWHERSLNLQKQILQRMRDFGIIPVLPAFAGHLPEAFKRLYPDVNMVKLGRWNDFNDTYCCTYFLDPTEELFKEIGKLFMEEQIAEYGTDHVYNCDSFNEVDPTSTDLDYLANVSKSIYGAMTETDPDAIWIMQGWLFYYSQYWEDIERARSFLTSVPLGKMIILDLQSEQFPQYNRLQQYFGQPYIWCMLHNFGGTLGMFGSADIINLEPYAARSAENSTMIGIGLTPEGINQNYVIYDLMTEHAWRKNSVNLTQWFENYTELRYGKSNEDVIKGWKLLQDTVYNFKGVERMRGQYAITRTPSLKITTWIWYKMTELFEAWDFFIAASEDLKDSPGYLHDLVDITRQVLQVNGDVYYKQLVTAFKNKDTVLFNETATIFNDIFVDLQKILSTNEAFLLGPWIESAKNCASSCEDAKLFEYNARNQITLWGPNGEIMNYANKQWAGVVSDFFQPRWSLFIEYANEILSNGEKFNQSYIKQQMFEKVEEPFTFDRSVYPTEPTGDTVEIAREIHAKWWINLHKRTLRSKGSTKILDDEEDDINPYLHPYGYNSNDDPKIIMLK